MDGYFGTYGTTYINGQIQPVLAMSGMRPVGAIAPTYAGHGAVPPTLPSGVGAGIGVGATSGSPEAVAAATANPYSLQLSPSLWLIIFLVVGLVGLRFVHWRG